VVVIGSGATAVTLVPEMAKKAAHVTMLQRSPTYVVSRPAQDPVANNILQNAIDTLETRRARGENIRSDARSGDAPYPQMARADYSGKPLFRFDPNTLPASGWEELGLSPKTARTIGNYVSKGGKFRKPEDLKKIWGLPKTFYERVAAYIRIEGTPVERHSVSPGYDRAPPRPSRNINISDINTADSGAWIALPGIGEKLARRIATFRDKLGGFFSVDQVAETYGLPDSTFQKIRRFLSVNPEGVRKLHVNAATKEELGAHPYIRWKLANAIVEYRNQHGPYKSLEELRKIALMDEALLRKVMPYLEL
jgi:DNA uptake protein ComE-like DNA-binding protein